MGGKGRTPSLIHRVQRFVREHDLIPPGTSVIAAVSGGSDSVALAHVLAGLDAAGDLRLVALAHFNHQLRPTADRDEAFARGVAEALGRPLVSDREDVSARARRQRRSLEDAARAARHEFLARAREASGAGLIALGHTRDDQAETVLLRLLRGAGPRGLAGMHPRNGQLVRPLLECRRAALRDWLAERRLSFVEDESNDDVSISRNRVRAELLPLLAARFNPGIVDVLAGEAEIAREMWEWMDAAAADLAVHVVRPLSGRGREPMCEIDIDRLRTAPLALQRAVVWRAMRDVAGRREIPFNHVDAAIHLMAETGGATAATAPMAIDAPGQRLERIGSRLVLTGRDADAVGRPAAKANDAASLFRYPLSIPGEVLLREAGCLVSAEPSATVSNGGDARVVSVRRDRLGSLAVRNRRPGDRFRPTGLGGTKKLQDYFVDRKVARSERDAVPLVVDESDRIVWVAGYEIDEAFRVTDPAQPVLILKLRQV